MKKDKERMKIDRSIENMELGLNEKEVSIRIKGGYQNKSMKKLEKSTGEIIFKNTFTFFNIILLSIAGLFLAFMIILMSLGRQDVVDAHFGFSKFGFLIPAIMNTCVGTYQEIASRKTIRQLRIVTKARSIALRGGNEVELNAEDLVIDDIVLLNPGEMATADLRVLSGMVLVDESMLTGEADYIQKNEGDTILAGSSIIVGSAKAICTEVGDETYSAKLSQKVKSSANHSSELIKEIERIMRFLTICLGIVTVVIFITLIIKISVKGDRPELWDGMTLSLNDPVAWARIMITAGSYGVGIIPSGLILTTSVTMMISIASLSKKQTLVQQLYSLENLSRADTICLDKTGTLTDGTMILDDVRAFCHLEDVVYHVRNLLGSSESKNSTAMALFNKFGETKEAPIKEIIPFSSVYKYSGIVYDNGDRLIMGAPEYLLDKNDNRLSIVDEMAHLGKRVIALKLNDKLLCFFIISDHIRESARDTLKFFSENNVDVKVISGDNPITVSKIAKDCGIQNSDKYISLEGVSLEDIHNIATEYTVFGRVSPEQKEALVVALKEKGRKVAMTGDGVNDILALRKADSSISFANATEAAKSVSDVILLDNDFSHLKEVVGEGRRVIGNVQKTAILFLMKSIAIVLLAFFTSPLSKGQMWFTIENSYMLEATVIGTGGFFISISAGSKDPLKGSFVKNIRMKAIVAGLLAAVAIIIPILCFTIPSYFNQAPIIKAENVKTMVTILLTIAGYVVLLTLCLPFKGQQAFAFLITLVPGTILAFALPTSYIGGDPTGPEMFIDKTGTSFYNCQFFHELFQPWNASVIMNFYSDYKNYIVLAIFTLIMFPVFAQLFKLLDVYINNSYDKELSKAQVRAKRKEILSRLRGNRLQKD